MNIFEKRKSISYIKSIDNIGIFDNSFSQAYPQTIVAELVRKHLYGENSGKKKKVLIYGFDGARADSMAYLIPSTDQGVTGHNLQSKYSAVTLLKNEGGLYLSYAGGDTSRPETLQETSTAQGWASILTGKWGMENGVVKHTVKSNDAPTVLMEAAKKGFSAIFSSIWPDHFTITYKDEIALAKNKNLPFTFKQADDEKMLQSIMTDAIDSDTDVIFGINEFPDYNGHLKGFGPENYRYVVGITNADRYAYELIERVKARKEYDNEDWLFIITSDHGGHQRGHGTQSITDRMTFIATNKKI